GSPVSLSGRYGSRWISKGRQASRPVLCKAGNSTSPPALPSNIAPVWRCLRVEANTMGWFDKWRAQKKPPPVERVTVHVLDVTGPKRTEFWQIDKDVTREFYERYKALNGHLYVLINYMDGEPRINLVTQKNWDLVKGNM